MPKPKNRADRRSEYIPVYFTAAEARSIDRMRLAVGRGVSRGHLIESIMREIIVDEEADRRGERLNDNLAPSPEMQ